MRVWSGRVEVVAHFGLFVAVGMQQCFRGLCILKWQHVNTRAQWFFCTGTKWSMLHTSPVSGFSIVADKCTVLKIKFCYILQLTEMNPTLFAMFKIAKSIMGTMLGKSQNKFIPKGGRESRESIYETTYSLLVLLIHSVLWLNFAILSFWLGHKGHKNVISSSECGLLLFWPLPCLWMNH